jgi:hypothetical protein
MSRLAKLTKEVKPKGLAPIRALIYGIEGVGKSSFCADAPNPIFINAENGLEEIDGAKSMPDVETWQDLRDAVKELITGTHKFQTLALDSLDWIEKLAHVEIISKDKNKPKTINQANGGYGNGREASLNLHRELIADLNTLRTKRGMHILATAHYKVKKEKDPEAIADYDVFSIKLDDGVSALWREWFAAVLFARFETLVKVEDDGIKARAIGTGKHIMFTQKRPAWYAKNRYGLPYKLPVSWDAFYAARCDGRVDDPKAILAEIEAYVETLGGDFPARIEAAVKRAAGDVEQLLKIRNHASVLAGEVESAE